MSYIVFEAASCGPFKSKVGTYPDFETAKTYAITGKEYFVEIEQDADHPGYYDAFTSRGRILSFEPAA